MTAPRKVALTEEEILEAAENHATRFAPIQRQTTAIAGYTAGAYMVRDFYEQRGAEKDAALVRERECREKLVAALESASFQFAILATATGNTTVKNMERLEQWKAALLAAKELG